MGYVPGRPSKKMTWYRLPGRIILLLFVFCCGFILYYVVNNQVMLPDNQMEAPYLHDMAQGGGLNNSDKKREAWKLILVNKWNPIPENYQVELTELSNGQLVDRRIYPSLQKMFDAARREGIYPTVASGYRTAEKQQRLMDEKIAEYEAEGCSTRKAEKKAKEWVAVPGTSEHQLGLGVDINADGVHSKGSEVYNWLDKNGYKFGFIRRYPRNKTDITGIINEPWHYRYVGVEAAKEMYRTGVCLEEYLHKLESGR